MTTDPFALAVRRFIASDYLLGREDGLTDDASFLADGILDSTGVLQLIAFLEESYDVVVENDEVVPDNLDSVNKVAAYLARKLAVRSSPDIGPSHARTVKEERRS